MDFGKSLCVLCRQPLAQATLVATPSDCPTHYFHFTCLAQHARQNRQCPIDRIPFDNIVCDDGVPEASAPEQDEEKIKADNEEGEKEDDEGVGKEEADSSEDQVNVDDLPPLARMKISREEDDKSQKETPENTGQKILISSGPIGGERGLYSNDSDSFGCMICKTSRPGTRASPDCCEHWFHKDCLERYLGKNSVCPVRGCHREISTYLTSDGEVSGIQMTVECEYKIMVAAPDGFKCEICHEAQIGRHRAVAKPCNHMFHRQCLTDYVRSHKKCPVCENATTHVVCDTPGDLHDLHFD